MTSGGELAELREMRRVSSNNSSIRSELSRLFGGVSDLHEDIQQRIDDIEVPSPLSPPLIVAPLALPPTLPVPPGRRRTTKAVRLSPPTDPIEDTEPSWLSHAVDTLREGAADDRDHNSSASELSQSPTEVHNHDVTQLVRMVEALSEKLDTLEKSVQSGLRRKRWDGRSSTIPKTTLTLKELERQRGMRSR